MCIKFLRAMQSLGPERDPFMNELSTPGFTPMALAVSSESNQPPERASSRTFTRITLYSCIFMGEKDGNLSAASCDENFLSWFFALRSKFFCFFKGVFAEELPGFLWFAT
jgi:hypothetical protein